MKHEHSVQVATRIALVHIQQEYAAVLHSTTYSLEELFNNDRCRLSEYCADYQPHPRTGQLVDIVQEFGQRFGIWLPNAKHYVTSALFLFPDADFVRAQALVKNLATDYYLNDTMGRELYKYLSPAQQLEARQVIGRIIALDEQLALEPEATGIERANVEMLAEIRDISPLPWFGEFLKLYLYHIEVTHKDNSAAALGYLPTVDEYISMRNHTSGMPHIISLAEYAADNFLDWNWLASVQLDARLRRIHRAVALFGCLTNDLFSFEKEVIDNNADPNLVMAVAFNYPELSFEEVILHAAAIVRKVFADYVELMELMREKLRLLPQSEQVAVLDRHLATLEKIVQASWMWQVYTRRYKRPLSIWRETRLEPAATPLSA
ncbi:MAG: terpene synthase family protein [Candidatus Pseudobacter hemicellulosilyticus]|uniref:Terpene synthase n=1 Tax=Candidatus Pseudobacter hemicellulosilyticus TaxID=3121375 RepID=A0AAJ5WQS0_9BACT|nr:MAG: terpene synthase family protein [Pseudobacter sp.]